MQRFAKQHRQPWLLQWQTLAPLLVMTPLSIPVAVGNESNEVMATPASELTRKCKYRRTETPMGEFKTLEQAQMELIELEKEKTMQETVNLRKKEELIDLKLKYYGVKLTALESQYGCIAEIQDGGYISENVVIDT